MTKLEELKAALDALAAYAVVAASAAYEAELKKTKENSNDLL